MKKSRAMLEKIVSIMNEAAGWLLGLCMLLVTVNVIMRTVFGKPILGAYEWVGILTSLTIGLGLAYCANKDAHISIDFIAEKFKPSARKVLSVITGSLSVVFMSVVFYSVFKYAFKLFKSGEVSPTTRIPFYIFVAVTGFSFVFLTLILLLKTIRVFRRDDK